MSKDQETPDVPHSRVSFAISTHQRLKRGLETKAKEELRAADNGQFKQAGELKKAVDGLKEQLSSSTLSLRDLQQSAKLSREYDSAERLTSELSFSTTPSSNVNINDPSLTDLKVTLTIHDAKNLVAKDRNIFGRKTKSDPYVKVLYNDLVVGKTSVKKSNLSPSWETKIEMSLDINEAEKIRHGYVPSFLLVVYDKDIGKKDDSMGSAVVPIALNRPESQIFPITNGDRGSQHYCKNASGKIRVSVDAMTRLPPEINKLQISHGKKKTEPSRAQGQQISAKLQESQRRLDGHQEQSKNFELESIQELEDVGKDRDMCKQFPVHLGDTNNRNNIQSSGNEPQETEANLRQLSEAEETCDLVETLHLTNRQNRDAMKNMQLQLSETETKYESQLEQSQLEKAVLKESVKSTKKDFNRMENRYYELAGRVARKAQEQIVSHNLKTEHEIEQWKEKHDIIDQSYDELVQKVESLALENGDLVEKRQRLEEKETTLREELTAMEVLQSENEALNESIQAMEEAMQCASGMSEHIKVFVEMHEADVAGYEKKMAALNAEKMKVAIKCRLLQKELDGLRGE